MRKAIKHQIDFTAVPITEVKFDLSNRHEINSILRSLQHVYSHPRLLHNILGLIKNDIVGIKRFDIGAVGYLW